MSSRPVSVSRATTTSNRPNALTIAAALAAGLLLRLWFIVHTGHVSGDSLLYGDIAKSWLDHGIYGFSQNIGLPHPTLIRLPGYPLFLAICFTLFGHEHYTAVMYVQVALDLITCLLIAVLAGRLFGRRAALAALWLSVLCPFTASYVAAPLTETPTLTCIALAFYALHRWQETTFASREAATPYNRWLYILAAALSYSILLRPEQGLLAAAILPAMLWIALRANPSVNPIRSATPVLLTAILIILPFFPWTLRNWHTFHVIQPLAPRYATDPGESVPYGFQRWFRTWGIDFADTDNVYWNYNGATIAISDLPARAFDSDSQYTRTEALLADYNQTTNASPAFDARFGALARERIAANPLRYYVVLPVARMLDMAFRPRTEMFNVRDEWWRYRQHPGQTIFSAAYAALNLAYFVLAAIGLRRWRTLNITRPSWIGLPALAWAMIASIALRSALLLTLDNSEPRYTLEFFPALIVVSAAIFATQHQKTDQ
jgi:4-amino-4-deoxy-L-arabinose transferase-like glycosyltransferase